MKNFLIVFCVMFAVAGCSFKDKYDAARYYDAREQDEALTRIVTYIFEAPPYTKMEDRFAPKHKNFYSFAAGKFSLEKYYVASDGTHYFYVIRPGPNPESKRGVGGYYTVNKDRTLNGFREVFVTPLLPVSEVKNRCAFLFDEMVKGTIDQYLTMESYVQWPNPATYYDTITYQWKLKPESGK